MNTNLRPHNMVLSDYEGKTSKALRVTLANIVVGTVVRPTLFVVIPSRDNYNLLMGQEWIHGMEKLPSN